LGFESEGTSLEYETHLVEFVVQVASWPYDTHEYAKAKSLSGVVVTKSAEEEMTVTRDKTKLEGHCTPCDAEERVPMVVEEAEADRPSMVVCNFVCVIE
jgi:hypothetical protein